MDFKSKFVYESLLHTHNDQILYVFNIGKSFEQVLQPTLLIGTLNGHSLETDKIEPSSNPQYATDLIWETNKTALRK